MLDQNCIADLEWWKRGCSAIEMFYLQLLRASCEDVAFFGGIRESVAHAVIKDNFSRRLTIGNGGVAKEDKRVSKFVDIKRCPDVKDPAISFFVDFTPAFTITLDWWKRRDNTPSDTPHSFLKKLNFGEEN